LALEIYLEVVTPIGHSTAGAVEREKNILNELVSVICLLSLCGKSILTIP